MTQHDLEVVERLIEAWNQRDLERLLALVHPEVEYVNAPIAVEPGTRHGRDAFATVVRKQWESLGTDAHQEVQNVAVAGNEVVVTIRLSRTLPGSTTRIENSIAVSWRVDDGLITRVEVLGPP